jgi:DNA-directed RNA polymerase specialized sigma subunit
MQLSDAEYLLEQCGLWSRTGLDNVGFKSCAVFTIRRVGKTYTVSEDQARYIDACVSALIEKEKTFLRLYFVHSISIDNCAKKMHIGRKKVHVIRLDAMNGFIKNFGGG